MRIKRWVGLGLLLALAAMAVPGATFGAGGHHARAHVPPPDWRFAPNLNDGHKLPLRHPSRAMLRRAVQRSAKAASDDTAHIGDVKVWLALDDANQTIYPKFYQLRGIGKHIEVWVADDSDSTSSNLDFPAGDCRNGARTEVTDAQITSLMDAYDNNILPKESQAFSVAPPHDGSDAPLASILGLPADYYEGDGGKTVTLVDNVRDSNFYDHNNSQGHSYIAGFFDSQFDDLANRNIMTIDGYDWLHRTGANPPNQPVAGNLCTSAAAHPFLYESVFAHEYQHLLENYQDPGEESWVNEGLSVWAESLTGYSDPGLNVWQLGFDSQVGCFLGQATKQTKANPNPSLGGPENSLTLWGDQGDDEILCDYGAARTFMEYLANHFGEHFMSMLHRDPLHGLDSLNHLLAPRGLTAETVLHRWVAMVALDRAIEQGAALHGGNPALYSTDSLHSKVRWLTPQGFNTPGAPPNGADFVRLRSAPGVHSFLTARGIHSLTFDGAGTLPSLPLEWTVDHSPPGHAGNAALYSGSGPSLDRALIRQVDVPAGNPSLTFDTSYDTEPDFDYGFVQVSTDGGATWKSLANADTVATADPTAIQQVKDNLPGLNGDSGGWKQEQFDLSAYAGTTVLLSFRYVTDTGVDLPGWWVDNVKVGGTSLTDGSSLSGWESQTQARPIPVSGLTVQLVAYDGDRTASWLGQVPLDSHLHASLGAGALHALIGDRPRTVVAALVMYDEPTELIGQYAPYRLMVNGVKQPGGGM